MRAQDRIRKEFDVNRYWIERGKTYIYEERLAAEYYHGQERFLLDVLSASAIRRERILEIGCGFGRIMAILAKAFPQAEITAVDLSPDQLGHARRLCARFRNVSFFQHDIHSGAALPGGEHDVSIAVEVFLHHPLSVIEELVERLAWVSPWIVNLDWSEEWPWELAEHVWVHDYAEMYESLGFACQALTLPEKIEGMQQKLFVARRGGDRQAKGDEAAGGSRSSR